MNFLLCILCFSLMLSSNNLASNTPQQTQNHTTIVPPSNVTVNCPINIKLNNENMSSTDAVTSSESKSTAKAVNKIVSTTMTTLMHEIRNKVKSAQEYAAEIPERLRPWVLSNKWRIIVSCATCLYAYTWYRLLYLSYTLSDPDAWHNYKATVPFEELLHIKQEELAQELIRAIQRTYVPQAVEDFFIPFTLFIKDVEKEIEMLEQLIKIYKRIRILHVNWLFPLQNPSYEQTQEKLHRVLYLRNVAFSWIGSFKFEKYTQLAPEHLFSQK